MDWEEVVAELDVSVTEEPLPNGWWGVYLVREHLIVLSPWLGPVQRISTLAHECGHAYYRHDGTAPKQERQAELWACRRLINQSDFIDALRVTDECQAIAQILGVMPTDVATYASNMTTIEKLLVRQMLDPQHIQEERAG